MPYPHGSTCRCPPLPSQAGLLGYTVNCDHHEQLTAALAKLADKPESAVTLRVLTTETPAGAISLEPIVCDGSLTCPCAACDAERAARVKRGVRKSEPIPIRRRLAA
ncbi:MAG TPA: hypothetical protein VN803_06365 [Gemmatimonadales bacterium]|nr:hypothetical protein [Gemmatimonadales bacterium]